MLEKIIEILKESKADAWEITDTKTRGWEFYFIRHDLDQNRAKDVEHIRLTVHRSLDNGEALGSASDEINPTDSIEDIKRKVEQLIYTAGFVKNKAYSLVKPSQEVVSNQKTVDIAKVAEDFITTMRSIHETETEDINSYEIFVNEVERRYVNSEGVDLCETYPNSMVEAVVNARKDGHEIELYRMYNSGGCDKEGLTRDVTKTLQYGKDRLSAVPTPKLPKMAVIFSTSDSTSIYQYFIQKLAAASVYRKLSDWKIGEAIAQDVKGDTSITMMKVHQSVK